MTIFGTLGLEVEKRWKEARLKLRRSVLRGLTKELDEFERITDEANRDLRSAQVAAVGRKPRLPKLFWIVHSLQWRISRKLRWH